MYIVFYQTGRGGRGRVCETTQELERLLRRLSREGRPARVIDAEGREVGAANRDNWYYETAAGGR